MYQSTDKMPVRQ